MANRSTPLSPPESAALTRLVIAYCLGRGSLCKASRTLCLQLYHPARFEEYAFYQWRRIRRFLPSCRPPRLHEQKTGRVMGGAPQGFSGRETLGTPGSAAPEPADNEEGTQQAQWRMRVSSLHFQSALHLLYPMGGGRGLEITSDALSLVGAEALASLWADRGRLMRRKSSSCVEGRLNLSRLSFGSAATIAQWIAQVAWAQPVLAPNPRYPSAPMLFFDHTQMARFLGVLGETWMATAPSLASKFALPAALDLQQQLIDERLAFYTPIEAAAQRGELTNPDPMPTLRTASGSGPRKAPTLPPEIPAARR
jgi:hypothetical protein